MTTHYRRLTSEDVAALRDEFGCAEYEALASFAGVRIATSGGDAIVQVLGEDRPGLPGSFEANTIAEMHFSVRRNVLCARWEPVDADDPGYGPESQIPDGAQVLETGINPHTFA